MHNFNQHLFDQLEHKFGYKKEPDCISDYTSAFSFAKEELRKYYETYKKENSSRDKFYTRMKN